MGSNANPMFYCWLATNYSWYMHIPKEVLTTENDYALVISCSLSHTEQNREKSQ